jgi:hypothetical protein
MKKLTVLDVKLKSFRTIFLESSDKKDANSSKEKAEQGKGLKSFPEVTNREWNRRQAREKSGLKMMDLVNVNINHRTRNI